MKLKCPKCKQKLEIDFEFTKSFITTCPTCQHKFEIEYKQKVVYREPQKATQKASWQQSIRLFIVDWFTSMSQLKILMFGIIASVLIAIISIFIIVQTSKVYNDSKLVLLDDDSNDDSVDYDNYYDASENLEYEYQEAISILDTNAIEGLKHLQKVANQNHAEANRILGNLNYHGGAGLNVNIVKAMRYWKVAANMGDTIAAECVQYYEPYSKIDQSESLEQKQTTAEVCKSLYELNLKLRTNGNNNQRTFYVTRSRYMANLDYRYINPSVAKLLSDYIEIDTRIIQLYDKFNMGMKNTVGVTELGADLGKIAGVVTSDRYNRDTNPALGQFFGLVIGAMIESEMKDDVQADFKTEFEIIKKQMATLDELVLIVMKTIQDEY